ncbi:MAG: toprim domain-containing protein, partial [Woeseia sp.]
LIIRKDNGQHYDRFRERIMYPIRDSRGRCIGFGGRVMGNDEPKYLNSPETALFHKGRELYGLYEARQAIRHIERLVVVEGYMDVIGLARHGIDFAVATLGTATTEDHLNRLFRLSDDVFFSFDGDRAGRAAAWRALETALPHMREGRQIRFIFLPDGEDPDSFVQQHGTAAFEKLLDAGMQLSDFLINELASQVELTSVDGRARLAELAKPLLSRLPDGFYRELLTATLAETVGLSPAKLDALLNRPAKGAATTTAKPAGRNRRSSSSSTGKPSVIRRAITLLLHYPQAGLELDSTVLGGINRPGAELLKELIESVQSDPDITTAGLLERWRHHEQGRHLGKLAATELPLSEDFDAGAELADCLHQLRQASAKARIENLIENERLGALSGDQKQELRSYRRDTTSGG